MCLYIRLYNVFCDDYIRHNVVCVSLLWHRDISCSSFRCGERGEASVGMVKAYNPQKLFIGQIWHEVVKKDFEVILRAKGCQQTNVHLVPGLSLFRRMACLTVNSYKHCRPMSYKHCLPTVLQALSSKPCLSSNVLETVA